MNQLNKIHLLAISAVIFSASAFAAPPQEPVVARVEMQLTDGDKVIDVIEKGDLLTVLEEKDDVYVIYTHDGAKGALDKVNAVKIAEATQIYTDLILRDPSVGRYYTLRASSWWALGKTEKAQEDYNRAIELGYEEAHAFVSRGLFFASQGKHDEAIDDYNRAIKLEPDDPAPLINRAAVHMVRGEYVKAAQDYTRAFAKDTTRFAILHQRAIAYKAAGDFKKATEDFSTLLKHNPKDVVAIMGRGYIRFQQENHKAAIKDFGLAIELNENDAVAYNNRGYNRFKIGEHANALVDYNKAIELTPKYSLAHQNRAWLLATVEDPEIRDPKTAIESAQLACELTNFQSVSDLAALAAAFAADGQFKQAVGWQEKVVDLVNGEYKEFATKTLKRYENERPFAADPDEANAREKAEAEAKGKEAADIAAK